MTKANILLNLIESVSINEKFKMKLPKFKVIKNRLKNIKSLRKLENQNKLLIETYLKKLLKK